MFGNLSLNNTGLYLLQYPNAPKQVLDALVLIGRKRRVGKPQSLP